MRCCKIEWCKTGRRYENYIHFGSLLFGVGERQSDGNGNNLSEGTTSKDLRSLILTSKRIRCEWKRVKDIDTTQQMMMTNRWQATNKHFLHSFNRPIWIRMENGKSKNIEINENKERYNQSHMHEAHFSHLNTPYYDGWDMNMNSEIENFHMEYFPYNLIFHPEWKSLCVCVSFFVLPLPSSITP